MMIGICEKCWYFCQDDNYCWKFKRTPNMFCNILPAALKVIDKCDGYIEKNMRNIKLFISYLLNQDEERENEANLR